MRRLRKRAERERQLNSTTDPNVRPHTSGTATSTTNASTALSLFPAPPRTGPSPPLPQVLQATPLDDDRSQTAPPTSFRTLPIPSLATPRLSPYTAEGAFGHDRPPNFDANPLVPSTIDHAPSPNLPALQQHSAPRRPLAPSLDPAASFVPPLISGYPRHRIAPQHPYPRPRALHHHSRFAPNSSLRTMSQPPNQSSGGGVADPDAMDIDSNMAGPNTNAPTTRAQNPPSRRVGTHFSSSSSASSHPSSQSNAIGMPGRFPFRPPLAFPNSERRTGPPPGFPLSEQRGAPPPGFSPSEERLVPPRGFPRSENRCAAPPGFSPSEQRFGPPPRGFFSRPESRRRPFHPHTNPFTATSSSSTSVRETDKGKQKAASSIEEVEDTIPDHHRRRRTGWDTDTDVDNGRERVLHLRGFPLDPVNPNHAQQMRMTKTGYGFSASWMYTGEGFDDGDDEDEDEGEDGYGDEDDDEEV